ncbi:hypothetical protein DFH09DRAFT_1082213 [Mycena vulgaris]|nr:hypothetical protein DFH09DRAFT_1082213 [Mycena vulgaris]
MMRYAVGGVAVPWWLSWVFGAGKPEDWRHLQGQRVDEAQESHGVRHCHPEANGARASKNAIPQGAAYPSRCGRAKVESSVEEAKPGSGLRPNAIYVISGHSHNQPPKFLVGLVSDCSPPNLRMGDPGTLHTAPRDYREIKLPLGSSHATHIKARGSPKPRKTCTR